MYIFQVIIAKLLVQRKLIHRILSITYPFIDKMFVFSSNTNVFRTMFVRFLPCERVMRMDCCLFVESQAEHVRLFDHMIS